MKSKDKIVGKLTREIWNEFIAVPKNKNGHFQVSPSKLKEIIEKNI